MRSLLQLTLDFFSETVPPAKNQSDKICTETPHTSSASPSEANPPAPPCAEPMRAVLPPAQFLHPRANRKISLSANAGKRIGQGGGECVVAYEFRRTKRKTIGFVIGPDGLVVSAPSWVPLHEVGKALQEKSAWIIGKLVDTQERQAKQAQAKIEWKEGALIPFLGEKLTLSLDPRQGNPAGTRLIPIAQLPRSPQSLPAAASRALQIGLPNDASPERIRDCVVAWLMHQAKQVFQERLDFFAPQLGVRWTKLSLSHAKSRWGSASSNGAIALNWRLIHFSASVIDYVVVHELSHLRVMDHSPRFWNTVQSILPDYAQRKSLLKDESIPPYI
jgi:predicted metal-dependent hydrolase